MFDFDTITPGDVLEITYNAIGECDKGRYLVINVIDTNVYMLYYDNYSNWWSLSSMVRYIDIEGMAKYVPGENEQDRFVSLRKLV